MRWSRPISTKEFMGKVLVLLEVALTIVNGAAEV
jgi:hypothetical protein